MDKLGNKSAFNPASFYKNPSSYKAFIFDAVFLLPKLIAKCVVTPFVHPNRPSSYGVHDIQKFFS